MKTPYPTDDQTVEEMRRQPLPWKGSGFVEWALSWVFPRFDIMFCDEVYLRRWCPLFTRWGHVFIHKVYLSDQGPLHDHPWDCWILLLRGKYDEQLQWRHHHHHTLIGNYTRRAPSLRYHVAEDRHKLTIRDKPTWSALICKPYRREWGFWPDGKWVYWREYLGIPK